MPNAGQETGVKLGETRNRCKAREDMQPMPARENLQPVPSAGKHEAGAKRGKTCNWYHVTSAGKHVTFDVTGAKARANM